MSWPEVLKALHLLLPFIREMFFGKRRVFHNLSKDQINTMVTSLGIGAITMIMVTALMSAIHKEAELNEEIRRLEPYEDVVVRLSEEYDIDLLEGALPPLDVPELPHEPELTDPNYDTLWAAYEELLEENRRLVFECRRIPDSPPTPGPIAPMPAPEPVEPDEEQQREEDSGNEELLKKLEGLW